MLSKKEISQSRFQLWQEKILCPHCRQPLMEVNFKLCCSNRHTFDIAKQGYINLAPQHHEEHYNKSLFEARHQVMHELDFYQGLHEQLVTWLDDYIIDRTEPQRIIDLGTGEGTHLVKFIKKWALHQSNSIEAIGLDLSKDGIATAAKHYTGALWLVADLSKLPLIPDSVDGSLTILSPSNYTELKRVLKPGAWFIKVMPGENYLRELRQIILPADEVPHANSESVNKFMSVFRDVKQHHFFCEVPVNHSSAQMIAQMTPLFWHASPQQLEKVQALSKITVELQVLIGRN